MGRALGSILIFLLVVGVARRSSGGAEGNDLCPGLTDGALAESFQGPGRLNEADAKFCCGTCSAPYWCSSEDARLDQAQCLTAGQLEVISEILEQVTTEVPGRAPAPCSDKFPTWVMILIFFLGMFPGVFLPDALRYCYRRFWLGYEDLSQAEQQLPPEEIQPPQTGSVAAHLPRVQDPYHPSASSLLENGSVPGTGFVNPVYQAGGVTNTKPAVPHDAAAPSSSSGPTLEGEAFIPEEASPSPGTEAAHDPEADPSALEGLPAPASIDDPLPSNVGNPPRASGFPPALDTPPAEVEESGPSPKCSVAPSSKGGLLPKAMYYFHRRFWLDYEDLSQAEQQLPPEEIQPPFEGSVAAHLPRVQDPYHPYALLENGSVPGTGFVNPVYQAGGVTNSKPAVPHDATAPGSSSGTTLEVDNCSSEEALPLPDAEAAHGPEMDPSALEGLPAPASIDDPPPCNPEGAPGPGILPPALDNPPDGQWSICLVEIPEDEGATELSLV